MEEIKNIIKKYNSPFEKEILKELEKNNDTLFIIHCLQFLQSKEEYLNIEDLKQKFPICFYNEQIDNEKNVINNTKQELNILNGIFTCLRCKSNRTVSYQKQTRRADEGETTFIECITCKFKFTL